MPFSYSYVCDGKICHDMSYVTTSTMFSFITLPKNWAIISKVIFNIECFCLHNYIQTLTSTMCKVITLTITFFMVTHFSPAIYSYSLNATVCIIKSSMSRHKQAMSYNMKYYITVCHDFHGISTDNFISKFLL